MYWPDEMPKGQNCCSWDPSSTTIAAHGRFEHEMVPPPPMTGDMRFPQICLNHLIAWELDDGSTGRPEVQD